MKSFTVGLFALSLFLRAMTSRPARRWYSAALSRAFGPHPHRLPPFPSRAVLLSTVHPVFLWLGLLAVVCGYLAFSQLFGVSQAPSTLDAGCRHGQS